jgi:hypothetical protein
VVDDPLEVEVVEPVEVHAKPNGSHRLTVGYALLSLGIIFGLYFGFTNDQKLANEIHTRCVKGNELRRTLHDEHTPKLAIAQKNLRRWPNGVILQVNGQSVHFSRAQLQLEVDIEQSVLKETTPVNCDTH